VIRQQSRISPPEGGVATPIKQMSRYLSLGVAGEVRTLSRQVFDLPGRAESKVAFQLFDRRGHPSFEEGILPLAHSF
jgi:hypothetical protein